ncbi:BCCT family transporter [Thiohalophilus thiocyanatoxydans]|uniref:Choline/glycine/proline betaine transport protein n=1 Tax=Thiohalophilus thiocyanatoxydans TaxID=381308 RepID=A0A4R8ISN8_9GAMM|nr:BCCT family transporter [Thiohalophilus thiocyanatoxydans]TDY00569.1 choline/glycine/proline betaine transport protein [Thiohalophilus thiocyanatoxydans]
MYNVATRGPFKGLNPRAAFLSMLGVLIITLLAIYRTAEVEQAVVASRAFLTPLLEWYYVVVMAFFLAMVIWLGTGRYKNVRLGHDEEVPEFTTLSWLAMLFAAGMGVGLLFWAVAEPLSHYAGNPFVIGDNNPMAADMSMVLTYFHWGLNAWGVFALLALILAYFGFRKGQPLALRSALHPLLGKHTHGWAGDMVDLLAILATVFGIVTTLGLGVQQFGAGLEHITGLVNSTTSQLFITFALTLIAIISVVTGLHVGVQRISQANLWLSVALLVLLLIWGPTQYLLSLVVQSTGTYFQNLLSLSFYTHANQPGDWHANWTVFYWGWWLAWAPFVGLFIARISRGRTLREFVFGVLLIPTLITFVWLGLLGGTALYAETTGLASIAEQVAENLTRATFITMATLQPAAIGWAGAILITVLIATYLLTSANAGIIVINTLLAHGATDHRPVHLILWGLAIGLLTAVLLLGGGLETLQGAVIMAALPFSLVMLVMAVGLLRGLQDERYAPRPGEYNIIPSEPWQIPDRLPESYDEEDSAPSIADSEGSPEQEEHRVGSGAGEHPSNN